MSAPAVGPPDRPSIGPWIMLVASVLFALMGLGIKAAAAHVGPGQLVWWRNLVQLLGALALLRAKGGSMRVVNPRALAFRSGFGVIAMLCYFGAISRLPLGDAVLLTYTMPVFVALFSPPVTGEARAVGLPWALAVGLLGVSLVADPRFTPDGPGVLMGLAASVLAGGGYVWLRVSTRTDARERIVAWFSLTCVVVTTPSWWWGGPPATWDGLGALVFAGVMGLAATWLLTWAYEEGPTDVVALFGYATPVCAYLMGAMAFGEPVTWRALGGVALVVLSGTLVRRRA